MRCAVAGLILVVLGEFFCLVPSCPGQSLREVLILRVPAGTVGDQLVRNCRSQLAPAVRMTWVEGRPADHPWPAPVRSRGVVVVDGSDEDDGSSDVPAHLPRLRLRPNGQREATGPEILTGRTREEFLNWVVSHFRNGPPVLELVPPGSRLEPQAGVRSESPDRFLEVGWRKEHRGAFSALVIPRALETTVSIQDVLTSARAEGLPVLTGDRAIWASGADGAWLPDLGFGGLLLAMALETVADGGRFQTFRVPSRVHARIGADPRVMQGLPEEFFTRADVLLRERGP